MSEDRRSRADVSDGTGQRVQQMGDLTLAVGWRWWGWWVPPPPPPPPQQRMCSGGKRVRSAFLKQNPWIGVILLLNFEIFITSSALQCRFSQEWRGRYFQSGLGEIIIRENVITTKGNCIEQSRDYFLFENKEQNCFSCLLLLRQHKNLIQYKESFCTIQSSLKLVCAQIRVETPLYTLVREPSLPIRCPFQDAYQFKYNDLTHGFCDDELSYAEPCASPSKYHLKFRHCEDTAMYNGKELKFECLASWKDGSETYLYSRLSGIESAAKDDRYRCFKYTQYGNEVSLAMSADATCRGLRTAKDGPFLLEFTEDNSHWPPPSCHFPDWLKGVTWRDLIGRYRYTVDEHGERLFASLRGGSSRGQVSSQFRCRHITSSARRPSTDEEEYTINTFATNDCSSSFQCLKIRKLASQAIELHIGTAEQKENHVSCQTENVYQNVQILTADGNAVGPGACPRPGMHHTAPAEGCIYRLNVGCRSEANIEIDHSCSPGKQGTLLECLSSWSDLHRSYVIVKHKESDVLNCYSFREDGGLMVFGIDPSCNGNISQSAGQHNTQMYTSLRHENCRRELRTTAITPTALHKSATVTKTTGDNNWPLSNEDYHRKDISIKDDLPSSMEYDDDDDDDDDEDDEFYDEDIDNSSGRHDLKSDQGHDQGQNQGYRQSQSEIHSEWVSHPISRPVFTTDSHSREPLRRKPVDDLKKMPPTISGPTKDQRVVTKGRKDLPPTKPHSTRSRSKSPRCRSSNLAIATVILIVLMKLLSSYSV